MIKQAEATPLVRLFRRIATAVAAVVGLIFLGIGVTQLLSLTWTPVHATVGQCTAHTIAGTGNNRTYNQNCVVSWTDGGTPRLATVDLGPGAPKTGQTVKLRVSGNTVVVDTSPWIGVSLVGLGLILVVVVILVAGRARRRRRAAAATPPPAAE